MKRNAALNTWGVLFYFFCQWLLTVVSARIAGYETAGQFSLAVSFCNIFSFIGMFGIRGIQVSDVTFQYSDKLYYVLRVATCMLATFLFGIALLLSDYAGNTAACCIAMMVFKLSECATDVVIGTMQRRKQFFWIAVSYTLRGVVPTGAFVGILVVTLSLPAAIWGMALASILCLLTYDLSKLRTMPSENNIFCAKDTVALIKMATPLMLTAILDSVLVYIPRAAVETLCGLEMLGYYSSISIVVVVLSTLSTGIWGSITPEVSMLLQKREYSPLGKLLRNIALLMVACAVVVLSLGNLLGPFFFKLLFGSQILEYMYLLSPILLNALLLLICAFFQCIFIPMKMRKALLYTNIAAVILCAVLSGPLTSLYGLIGACLATMISLLSRSTMLLIIWYVRWKTLTKEAKT